jgi:hypothetical protein
MKDNVKRDLGGAGRKNYIISNLVSCAFHHISSGRSNKVDEMGGTCRAHRRIRIAQKC